MNDSPCSYLNFNTIKLSYIRLQSNAIVGQKSSGLSEHKRNVSNSY